MLITKAVYDQIPPGEIFRVVSTSIHEIQGAIGRLTFVCVKAREGFEGTCLWKIYYATGSARPEDIARYGYKVFGKENIFSICPCDEEVLALYRK